METAELAHFTKHEQVSAEAVNFTCLHCDRKTVFDVCVAPKDSQIFAEIHRALFVMRSRGNTSPSTPTPYLPILRVAALSCVILGGILRFHGLVGNLPERVTLARRDTVFRLVLCLQSQ